MAVISRLFGGFVRFNRQCESVLYLLFYVAYLCYCQTNTCNMASEFGRKFYDILRIHIEQGIKSKYLDLSPEHRACVDIIDDLYEHYRHNPAMNTSDYIRNKYEIKDYARIYKLNKALNFVVGMMSNGLRDMQRFKANAYVDRMFRIGDATGDWKPMDKALAHLTKLNGLDQPDPAESIDEQIPKMGYMLTTKASDVREGAKVHTREQIAAMFKHYDIKPDRWQDQLDSGFSTADEYDEDGNRVRRSRLQEPEDAEVIDLNAEFEKEFAEEEERERRLRGYSKEDKE